MTESEALVLIEQALKKSLDKQVTVTMDTDLFQEKILDSLDAMVFFLELEELSGAKFPEENLAAAGFAKVRRIVERMRELSQSP